MTKMKSKCRYASAALAALLGVMAATSVWASDDGTDRGAGGYTFKILAALGDNVPTASGGNDGVKFDFDFEPGELNNNGQVAFGADMSIGNEGVFLTNGRGKVTTLARTGDIGPDGTVFGPLFLGTISNNDAGRSAFVFHRNGVTFPTLLALDAALYRYSPRTGTVIELLPGAAAPGGGTFHGYNFRPSINNEGTIAFSGIIETLLGPGNPGPSSLNLGLGAGVFTIDNRHRVVKVVRPGDRAPGGNTFDYAVNPSLSDEGDVAFGAHVVEDPFIQFFAYPNGNNISTAESVYVWRKESRRIVEIARQDRTPVPGDPGFTFNYAFGATANNRGDIAYFGAYAKEVAHSFLILGANSQLVNNTGIFLYSRGTSVAMAHPGDAMPGGGHMISAGFSTAEMGLNNNGVVTFTATLDSDENGDGFNDTGLYSWHRGKLSLVARSGTVLPGIGTIRDLHPPAAANFTNTFSGAPNNDRGQVAFQAALTNGDGVMLLATPARHED